MMPYTEDTHAAIGMVEQHRIVWHPGVLGAKRGWHRDDSFPLPTELAPVLDALNVDGYIQVVRDQGRPYYAVRTVTLTAPGQQLADEWAHRAREAV
jgi:hypothetical protein